MPDQYHIALLIIIVILGFTCFVLNNIRAYHYSHVKFLLNRHLELHHEEWELGDNPKIQGPYHLLSLDQGKTWYAVKESESQGLTILGLAKEFYPNIDFSSINKVIKTS